MTTILLFSEPVTMITDFILALVTFYLSYELYKQSAVRNQYFITGFLLFTIAIFTGGISHGFSAVYSQSFLSLIWKITLYAYGWGTTFLVLGVSSHSASSVMATFIKVLTICKITFYSLFAFFSDDFNMVAIDIFLTMLMILFIIFKQENDKLNTQWILYGVMALFVVGLVWFFKFGLHQYFNYNDLSHIILIFVMYSLYRGFDNV